ncbi:hypothetical protein FPSE_05334 [Fusarium pseudograminearum CS3096]|uniref:DUF3500 domain-containing protein n=1 Tax=Fusarium pseudograminearum (strain CS3096) TaxID=1028729 RepID=K3VJG0_FUSPC|nr:hypothetical protein FPSE_05334 [Fusarium pseudograminearum CS3096]EKJ74584.1 hypothetical protein FPSE_05334 [Fusarium pseudograminearum CS3096]
MSQSGHDEGFRQYLPNLNQPRFQDMKKQDAYEYAEIFKKGGQPPWLHGLYLHWRKLFNEPYQGVTSDGVVKDGLFELQDDGIPIESIVEAANSLCSSLSEEQKNKTFYHIDSPEWRSWSNPEFLLSDKGIRLDEVTNDLREKVLKVLGLTLSDEGYEKAIGAMRVNHFLGELVESPSVMNEFSYNFALFGDPSTTRPWGFSFYGHHLCLNIFLYKSQIVVSPWFTGAEPNLIDDGPYKGTRILHREEALGLKLMQSLSPDQKKAAQVYELMKDPAMPHARWNHDDQRHLCGAYRDNRVVPYEGILVSEMTEEQHKYVLDIAYEFLLYLPAKARQIRLDQIKEWFHETARW